jgi:DNA-3-methyladenine glycosylase I
MVQKVAEDSKKRCPWCEGADLYRRYHDEEWGVPVHDDRKHFEFLVLESAQAGLSWSTILKKRENYRKAYRGFDPKIVARFGARDIERLLQDAGIVRNRLKIESSINNAKRFLEIQGEFGSFDAYLWGFVGGSPVVNRWKTLSEIPPKTELSDRISRDLKSRGFRFVGSTIIYAHLQAVGVVNDHLVGCFRYGELTRRNP